MADEAETLELPSYGDVWLVDFSATRGREQSGLRPALVISPNKFNYGPAELVIVIPFTRTDRQIPLHVSVDPPEAGLRERSLAMCEMIRSISRERLVQRWGGASATTMRTVTLRVRLLTVGP